MKGSSMCVWGLQHCKKTKPNKGNIHAGGVEDKNQWEDKRQSQIDKEKRMKDGRRRQPISGQMRVQRSD